MPSPSALARRAWVERLSVKVQAALWVVSAAVLLVYGRVIDVASDPDRCNQCVRARARAAGHALGQGLTPPHPPYRGFIFIGCAALAVVLTVAFYCVVWVRRVQGSQWPWEIVAPGMIETATAGGVVAFVSFTIGLWPAYGMLTPLVTAAIGMGGAMSLHFLPAI